MRIALIATAIAMALSSCKQQPTYTTIIRNGLIYDGNGGEPFKADIAINADTIVL